MSFKIDGGLFKYDFIDYHAVLCVAVDADAKEIRKRYLQIARRLHPDSSAVSKTTDKDIANELLSKLVNPAYEKLSVERNRAEYTVVLSQIGKRLAQESTEISLKSEVAKELVIAPNVDLLYKNAIAKIAETQFSELKQTPEFIAQISELNLVYLMRRAGRLMTTSPSVQQPAVNSSKPSPPSAPREDSPVEQYLRRAQTLIENNQFAPAKVELQDALKLEPKNSRSHSLMAMLFLRQNQLKMAKIHFDNALKLDPNDKLALEWKPKVDKVLGNQSGTNQVNKSADNGDTQPDKSGSGGLFGGLFGGKKK
ncbi:J domain-containing protein [Anabaena sp. UHCC 0451]|uniref:J domain-containing protein n=1 Tax=Anabaena sp. UHCC 0451 TaxID=2055235 RepID=UPI002B20FF79|nr:J domain-containing protein [Anabaena sp. UHCC 0451]MEA5578624.1 J domain-containing protein [Anabaena sp. UHCC 0451]